MTKPKDSVVSWRTSEGVFTRWGGCTAVVRWEYEQMLPPSIHSQEYKCMFPMSKVEGVRMFPYVEMEDGHRYYLCTEPTQG